MDVISVVVTVVLCFVAAGVFERSRVRDRATAVGRMADRVTVSDEPLAPSQASLAIGGSAPFSVWVTPPGGGKQLIGFYESRVEAEAGAHGARRAFSNVAGRMTAESASP